MNPVIRRAAVALAVVAVVAAGAFVFAQSAPPQRPGGGRMMGQGPGGPGGRGDGMLMLGRLNLTDDQRAQVQKLMDDNRLTHQPVMQKMVEAERALRNAIFADGGPDEQAIQAAQAAIQSLEPEIAQNRLKMEIAVAKILTPDQRKQAREMPPAGGRGRGRGGMGRMMHPGPRF
jgi:Spy/CpxP family protein refolding chaperone